MKPYIKKVGVFSGYTVYIVDGNYVRKNIDEEFTNYGQHLNKTFIPEKEFWLDKENTPNERKYFIKHLLIESKLMKMGMSYDKAVDIADSVEKKARNKSKYIQNIEKVRGTIFGKKIDFLKHFKEHEEHEKIIGKIHKKLLKEYSKSINVWIVKGNLVRTLFNLTFTQGGHDKVYRFIPSREVWIDDDVTKNELKFILIHELYERYLMTKGVSYDESHEKASKLEWQCRENIKNINKMLKIELKRQHI